MTTSRLTTPTPQAPQKTPLVFTVFGLILTVWFLAWWFWFAGYPAHWSYFKEKTAAARFKELCDTQAGFHVYKTVENVEGYLWVNTRPEPKSKPREEITAALNDPTAYCMACVASGDINSAENPYRYTEVQELDGSIKRYAPDYTIAIHFRHTPKPVLEATPVSRYIVTHEDINNPADLALWVGGGRLKIIDRQTGELLAEGTDFVRGNPGLYHYEDLGPWHMTNSCPGLPHYDKALFQVLKPAAIPELRKINNRQL